MLNREALCAPVDEEWVTEEMVREGMLFFFVARRDGANDSAVIETVYRAMRRVAVRKSAP